MTDYTTLGNEDLIAELELEAIASQRCGNDQEKDDSAKALAALRAEILSRIGETMNDSMFNNSMCGIALRRLTERIKEGHLYNALYAITEMQQALMQEIGRIRHGQQKDASWLERQDIYTKGTK